MTSHTIPAVAVPLVIAVPGIEGVYRVTLPGETRDSVVHEYKVDREVWSQKVRRKVQEKFHYFSCVTCQKPMTAPDCPHIEAVRRSQS